MKNQIPNEDDLKLLFTDTDSLCYHIKNHDMNEIMKNNKHLFDLSNYDKKHELYDKTNPKVIGKMKNESPEYEIIEFIGLRSKLYTFRTDKPDDVHNKCKGVKKSVAAKLTVEDYKTTLEERKTKDIKQNVIRSYKHQLFSESVIKTGLSYCDDKRYIKNNNIETLSFGHWKIKNNII